MLIITNICNYHYIILFLSLHFYHHIFIFKCTGNIANYNSPIYKAIFQNCHSELHYITLFLSNTFYQKNKYCSIKYTCSFSLAILSIILEAWSWAKYLGKFYLAILLCSSSISIYKLYRPKAYNRADKL